MKSLALALSVSFALAQDPAGKTVHVPADHPTIQAALDAARNGDTVLVEPGIWKESLKVAGKSVTLAARAQDLDQTILDGSASGKSDGEEILRIEKGGDVTLTGFTIRNSHHAVTVRGKAQIVRNRFHRNGDALSFEGGSGLVRSCTFEDNRDDGIDLDRSSEALIEDNVIRNNRDDGIEVRLHDHSGPLLKITIRGNVISGNQEDGIQLIDYPGKSSRIFRIERNVFSGNAMAAVGCMSDGNTKENYEGADLPEPIQVINNTFVDNRYGLTGGDNVVVLNNIFLRTARSALKKVDGDSIFLHNLFWQNGREFEECDLDPEGKVVADPLLGADFRPAAGSPCIDGGAASAGEGGQKIVLAPDTFKGRAPDLGAVESGK
jgi:parallel beta-helix repeat protein